MKTLFTNQAKAEHIAEANNAESDAGWIVVVEQHGKMYALAVYDEEQEFLGYL